MRSQGIVGDTQRIRVVAAPGLVKTCTDIDEEEPQNVCVRAGAPFPAMRVANGDIFEQEVSIHVTNITKNATWNVYLEPLKSDDPQDQRCSRDHLGPPDNTSARLANTEGANLLASLPACSSLVFVQTPSKAERERPYRIVVLGGVHMRKGEFQLFVDRIQHAEPPVSFVYFASDISIGNRTDSLAVLDDIMRDAELPWSVLISPYFVIRGFEALIDHIGAVDYVTRVFSLPLMVWDSSDARLSAAQQEYMENVRTCKPGECPDAIALMSIPPVSAHVFEVGVFRSQVLAMKVLEDLRERGVLHIVSSADKKLVKRGYSGLNFYDVGQTQDHERMLEIRFTPPISSSTICDGWTSIEGDARWTVSKPYQACTQKEQCVRGVCLQTCGQDADCTQAGQVCDPDGHCRWRCDDPHCNRSETCELDAFCEHHGRIDVFAIDW